MKIAAFSLITLLFTNCSGLEKSEQKKVREHNLTLSRIHRHSEEKTFFTPSSTLKKREPYPWESKRIGPHLRITKEFFRCKGYSLNPPIQIKTPDNRLIYHQDCGGIDHHSLPIKHHKEFIYPILIELLNYIQAATGKKVIITCGHRCPTHNLYADPSKTGRTSKHQVGAEVDFYVEGMEHSPHAIAEMIMDYYKQKESHSRYTHFRETSHGWTNHEVAIKLFRSDEGRDLDNSHPYPYIALEVKYDREAKRRIVYSWYEAHNKTYKR